MREKLNSNPVAQAVVIGFLVLATGFFLLSTMGGGEEEAESPAATTSATVADPEGATVTATVTAPAEAGVAAAPSSVPPLPPDAPVPPPPRAVTAAFDDGLTVVLLFVRGGGIDDRLVANTVDSLSSLPGASTFVVPADQIARYASIAQGVAVDRVPALVVLRPQRLDPGVPTASVHYGFQAPQSVVQAVVDAGYKGPTVDYHP